MESVEKRVADLVIRDGLYYLIFDDVPFTGRITGQEQGSFKGGKKYGLWVMHYRNGRVMSKETYKDGKRCGTWAYYYESGQLETGGTFKDGRKYGLWNYYDESGRLLRSFNLGPYLP